MKPPPSAIRRQVLVWPLAAVLGLPLPLRAEETADLEAKIAALETSIAAIKDEDRALAEAVVKQRVRAAEVSRGGAHPETVDPAVMQRFLSEYREQTSQRITREWIDSPVQDSLMGIVHREIAEFNKINQAASDTADPKLRADWLRAKLKARQAELNYFQARLTFMERYVDRLWADFAREMQDSLAVMGEEIAGKTAQKIIDGLKAAAAGRNVGEITAALAGMGWGLAKSLTADVFASGLREAWVKGLMVDHDVPRYLASYLYDRFIIPRRQSDTLYQDKVNEASAKFLAEKIEKLTAEQLRLSAMIRLALGRDNWKAVWGKILGASDMNKILLELSTKGTLSPQFVKQFALEKNYGALLDYVKSHRQGELLKEFNQRLGQAWQMESLRDITVQVAAYFSATGLGELGGYSDSAVQQGVQNFKDLEAWCAAHAGFGLSPRQESSRSLVIACLDDVGRWQQEASAYENAVKLEAQWREGGEVSAKDIFLAWRAVSDVRDNTWPPFARLASARMAYWKGVQEKPAVWARWTGDVLCQRNGRDDACAADHGDDLRIVMTYRVNGLPPKGKVEVGESAFLSGGERRKPKTRTYSQDTGSVPVEFSMKIPAGMEPGEHQVTFELSDPESVDVRNAGFTLSDFYPRWTGELQSGKGLTDSCAYGTATRLLTALQAETSKKTTNSLLSQLNRGVEQALSNAQRAQANAAEAQALTQKAGESLNNCSWKEGLGHASSGRRLVKKLPDACQADLAAGLDWAERTLSDNLGLQSSIEQRASRADKALKACRFDDAETLYAEALGLYNANLSGYGCGPLADAARIMDAKGQEAARRAQAQRTLEGMIQEAQNQFNQSEDRLSFRKAAQALAFINKSEQALQACWGKERAETLALATKAGKKLAAPPAAAVASTLPPDDASQRTDKVRKNRDRYVADQERQKAEGIKAQAASDAAARAQAAAALPAGRPDPAQPRPDDAARMGEAVGNAIAAAMGLPVPGQAPAAPVPNTSSVEPSDAPAAPAEPPAPDPRDLQAERDAAEVQRQIDAVRRRDAEAVKTAQDTVNAQREKEKAEMDAYNARQDQIRRENEERANLQKQLEEIDKDIAEKEECIRCMEEGKRKYPKMELSCHGNFLLSGSRDSVKAECEQAAAAFRSRKSDIQDRLAGAAR